MKEVLLLICFGFSVIIAAKSDEHVLRNGKWMGLDHVKSAARNSVIGLVLGAVSLALLVFGLHTTLFLKIVTGFLCLLYVAMITIGCWSSVKALWQYWRQMHHHF